MPTDDSRPQGPSLVVPMMLSIAVSAILLACLARVLIIAKQRVERARGEELLLGKLVEGRLRGAPPDATVVRMSWAVFIQEASLGTRLKTVAFVTAAAVFVVFGVVLVLLGSDFDQSHAEFASTTDSITTTWRAVGFAGTVPLQHLPPLTAGEDCSTPIGSGITRTSSIAVNSSVISCFDDNATGLSFPQVLTAGTSTRMGGSRDVAFVEEPSFGVLFNYASVEAGLATRLSGRSTAGASFGRMATGVSPSWLQRSNTRTISNPSQLGCAFYFRIPPTRSNATSYTIVFLEAPSGLNTTHSHCILTALLAGNAAADGSNTTSSRCEEADIPDMPLMFAVLVLEGGETLLRYGVFAMVGLGSYGSVSFAQWVVNVTSDRWSHAAVSCGVKRTHLDCVVAFNGQLNIVADGARRTISTAIFTTPLANATRDVSILTAYLSPTLLNPADEVALFDVQTIAGRFESPSQALPSMLVASGINSTAAFGIQEATLDVDPMATSGLASLVASMRRLGAALLVIAGLSGTATVALRVWAAAASCRAEQVGANAAAKPGHVASQAAASGATVSGGISGGSAAASASSAQGVALKEVLSPVVRVLQSLVLVLGVADSPLYALGMLRNLPIVAWLATPLDALFRADFIGSWLWTIVVYPLLLLCEVLGALTVELGELQRVPPIFPTLALWILLLGCGAALVLLLRHDWRELREVCTPEDVLHTLNLHRYDLDAQIALGSSQPPVPLLQIPSPPPTGLRGVPTNPATPIQPLTTTTPEGLIGLASQLQRLGAAGRTVAALLFADAVLPDLPRSFDWLRQSRGAMSARTPHRTSGMVGLASLALSMGSPALRQAALEAARSEGGLAGASCRVPPAPLLALRVHLGKLERAPPTMEGTRESTAHLPSLGPATGPDRVEEHVTEELEWRLRVLGMDTRSAAVSTRGGINLSQAALSSLRSSVLRASLQESEGTTPAFHTDLTSAPSPPGRHSTVTFVGLSHTNVPSRYGNQEESEDEDAVVEQAAAALVQRENSTSASSFECTRGPLDSHHAQEPLRSSFEPTLRPRTAPPQDRPQPFTVLTGPVPTDAERVALSGGVVKDASAKLKVSKAKFLKLELEKRLVFRIPSGTVLWEGPRRLSTDRGNDAPYTDFSGVQRTGLGISVIDQVVLSDLLLVSIRTKVEGLNHVVVHQRGDFDLRQLSLFGKVDMQLAPQERTTKAVERNASTLHSISWQFHVGKEIDKIVNGSAAAPCETNAEDGSNVMPSALTAQLVVDASRGDELLALSGSNVVSAQDALLPPTPLSGTTILLSRNPSLGVLQPDRCPTHGCRLVLATRSHVVAQDILRDVQSSFNQTQETQPLFRCAYHGPRGFTNARFRAGDRYKLLARRARSFLLGRLVGKSALGKGHHEAVCPGGDNMVKAFFVCPYLSARNSHYKPGAPRSNMLDGGSPFCCRYAVCADCFEGSSLYGMAVSYLHFVLHYVGYRYFFGFLLLAVVQMLLLPALRSAWRVLLCPSGSTLFLESAKLLSNGQLSYFIQQASFCLDAPSSISVSELMSLNPVNNTAASGDLIRDMWTYSSERGARRWPRDPITAVPGPSTYGFMTAGAALTMSIVGGGLCVFIVVNLYRRKQLLRRYAAAVSLSRCGGDAALVTQLELDALDAERHYGDKSVADVLLIVGRQLRKVLPTRVTDGVKALFVRRMTILDPPHGSSDDEAEPYEYDGPPQPLGRLRGFSVWCGRGWRWMRGGWYRLVNRTCAPLPWGRWAATLHRLDFSLTKSMYEHVAFRHMVLLQGLTFIVGKWLVAVVMGATSSSLITADSFRNSLSSFATVQQLVVLGSAATVGYSYRVEGLAVVPNANSTASMLPSLYATTSTLAHGTLESEASASQLLVLGTALLELPMLLYVLLGHVFGNEWVSLVVRLSSCHQLAQLGFTIVVGAAIFEQRGLDIRSAYSSQVRQLQAAWDAQTNLASSAYVSGLGELTILHHNTTAFENRIREAGVVPPSDIDEAGGGLKQASAFVFIIYLIGVGVALLFALVIPAIRAVRHERRWRKEQREAAVEIGLQ